MTVPCLASYPIHVLGKGSKKPYAVFFGSPPRAGDLTARLSSSLGFTDPQSIRLFGKGQAHLRDESALVPGGQYSYDFRSEAVGAVLRTENFCERFCFSPTQTVRGVKAFFTEHCLACPPERVTVARGQRPVADEEEIGRGPDVELDLTIAMDGCVARQCNFTFFGHSAILANIRITFSKTAVMSEAISQIAAVAKCDSECVKVVAVNNRPYPRDFSLAALGVGNLIVRLVSPLIFFRLRIGPRTKVASLILRPAVPSEARVQLGRQFELEDAAGITFGSLSTPVTEDTNLCWLETHEGLPLECEVLYETWFCGFDLPISWIHRSSATVGAACLELQRRFFSVHRLRDPELSSDPLDLQRSMINLKGRILQVEQRDRLIFVPPDKKARIVKGSACTLANVATNLHLPNAIFLSEFSMVAEDTRCDSLQGRLFVLPPNLVMPCEIVLPNGQMWRGDLPAVVRVRDVVPSLSESCPNLIYGVWSMMYGDMILPDDQFLCSVVLCMKPAPGGLRIVPGEIRISFQISDLRFDFVLSRSMRVSSLPEVLSKRFLFRSDCCDFWTGHFRCVAGAITRREIAVDRGTDDRVDLKSRAVTR
jgi:hypothetical protein